MLTGIVEASYTCIPIVGRDDRIPRKNKKRLPNYDAEVKPYRTATIYWHDQWVKAGRSRDDWLYLTMVLKRNNTIKH